MKKVTVCTMLALAAGITSAEAKGCIKGAVVGGVAGHAAHHAVLGAAAGCVAGRHAANKRAQQNPQNQQKPTKPAEPLKIRSRQNALFEGSAISSLEFALPRVASGGACGPSPSSRVFEKA